MSSLEDTKKSRLSKINKATKEDLLNIKKAIKEEKLIIGTKQVMKKLKTGKISTVYLSRNCPIKEDIKHLAEIAKIKVVQLRKANDELGIICKKPYSISTIGV